LFFVFFWDTLRTKDTDAHSVHAAEADSL
jgi:hypothetical protein